MVAAQQFKLAAGIAVNASATGASSGSRSWLKPSRPALRSTAQRLQLAAWDGSALRKLATLESIYQKLTDEVAARRLEILEWIIVILIAVSIVLPFIS